MFGGVDSFKHTHLKLFLLIDKVTSEMVTKNS